MTTTVQEFIKDKVPPVTMTLDQPVKKALRRMIEHDFSQLPIVDDAKYPIGIVTSDSILKALSNYGVSLDGIRIRHAMISDPHCVNENIDLLDLFDNMQDGYVLVISDENVLVGIVTTYDTTAYFRQRAQDILLVENIENTLKDFVQATFGTDPQGEEKLESCIQSMTNASMALQHRFANGLRAYLKEAENGQSISVDDDLVNEIFERYLDDKREPVTFDELTLSNYIDLFLYKDYWPRLEEIFELEKGAVKHLLDSVRLTRNDLAHFRDITHDQSSQLRDCYDFLIGHQEAVNHAFALTDETGVEEAGGADATVQEDEIERAEISPLADEPLPGESKYAALAIWLQSQPPEKHLRKPTFSKIEEIIGGKLPESAYKHRAWWANDSVGHSQSKQWLDVGWRVASVNMTKQVVRFARIKERQRAYIEFFSRLVDRLNEEEGFEEKQALPDGANWLYIKTVFIQGRTVASFNFAFGRQNIFRVEFYIDSGDQSLNKQLFDALHRSRPQIEDQLGHELSWQRLDSKRASRVAWNFEGHITDDEPQLEELREKATMAMVRLSQVIEKWLQELGPEILDDHESSD